MDLFMIRIHFEMVNINSISSLKDYFRENLLNKILLIHKKSQ